MHGIMNSTVDSGPSPALEDLAPAGETWEGSLEEGAPKMNFER